MWRTFRSVILCGMLLLLAVCNAAALEPKRSVNETAAVVPQRKDRPNATNSAASVAWKRQVVRLLERNKRYPAAAAARGEQGLVHVEFSLDRRGRVTASRIARSSGSTALDNGALQLVRRAQPFPPPPSDITGEQINLALPIHYRVPPCGVMGWLWWPHCRKS